MAYAKLSFHENTALKAFLDDEKVSIGKLSIFMGTSTGKLRQKLKNPHSFNLHELVKLAYVLNVDLYWLLDQLLGLRQIPRKGKGREEEVLEKFKKVSQEFNGPGMVNTG